jgi:hypothetical protein
MTHADLGAQVLEQAVQIAQILGDCAALNQLSQGGTDTAGGTLTHRG